MDNTSVSEKQTAQKTPIFCGFDKPVSETPAQTPFFGGLGKPVSETPKTNPWGCKETQASQKPPLLRKNAVGSYDEFKNSLDGKPNQEQSQTKPVKRHADMSDEHVKRIKTGFITKMSEITKDHTKTVQMATIKHADTTNYILHIKNGELTEQYEYILHN
jgi:hypothetical protein